MTLGDGPQLAWAHTASSWSLAFASLLLVCCGTAVNPDLVSVERTRLDFHDPTTGAMKAVLNEICVVDLPVDWLLEDRLLDRPDDAPFTARWLPSPRVALPEDIDLVYMWVNGSDPTWYSQFKEVMAPYEAQFNDSERILCHDPFCQNAPNTFTDHQELKYSIRSVRRHMPWIRHIYILTNRQVPSWLNREVAQKHNISVVYHEDIMPPGAYPSFNSFSIQNYEHLIPGLADYYLHLDDDMLVGMPVDKTVFFAENGFMKAQLPGNPQQHPFPDCQSCEPKNKRCSNNDWSATFYSGKVLDDHFGRDVYWYAAHGPALYGKRTMLQWASELAKEIGREAKKRFRGKCMLHLPNMYPSYLGRKYNLDQPPYWSRGRKRELISKLVTPLLGANNSLSIDSMTFARPLNAVESTRLVAVILEAFMMLHWMHLLFPYIKTGELATNVLSFAMQSSTDPIAYELMDYSTPSMDAHVEEVTKRLQRFNTAVFFSMTTVKDSELATKENLLHRLDQLTTAVSQTIRELSDTSGETSILHSVSCFSETSDVLSDIRSQLALSLLASTQIASGFEVERDTENHVGFVELSKDHDANTKALEDLSMQANLFIDINDDAGLKDYPELDEFFERNFPEKQPWEQ